jgi:hypothetical protein
MIYIATPPIKIAGESGELTMERCEHLSAALGMLSYGPRHFAPNWLDVRLLGRAFTRRLGVPVLARPEELRAKTA